MKRMNGLCVVGVAMLLVGCTPERQLPPGDVVLSETWKIGPESSGMTFVGASDGTTRIRGGVAITGWTDRGNGVWGAKLPIGVDGKPLFTESLFVNGRRAQRSRYPADGGFFQVSSVTQIVCQASVTTNRVVLTLDASNEAMALLSATPKEELPYAQIIAHVNWDVARYPIAAVDGVRFFVDAWPMSKWSTWRNTSSYALENVRGAFTHPGQWFYDVRGGEILYRPLKGEMIHEAIVPTDGLETLVAISAATNVVFENVTFAFSAPTAGRGPTHLPQYQAAALVAQAAVVADNARNITFRNCRFEHLGSYALWFREGCHGGGAFDCTMTDLGAGGVRVGGHRKIHTGPNAVKRPKADANDVAYVETAPWMTSHVVIDNCEIAHGGRFHPAGVGVLIGHASDCSVVHNDIYDLFYTGISVGWIWGYAGSPSQRNTIAFNHIRDIGQAKLADMGGIYLLGTAFGTCVSNNLIHGIHTYSYGGWGLYPDEGSEGLVLENNLVYDTDDASFHQHYGKDNVVRNNILIDSKNGQIAVTRDEPHRSMMVTRNIILWSRGDAFNTYTGTKKESAKIDWSSNLWWRVDGKDVFNDTSFEAWRQRVKDVGSVFADPGFADWRKRDFRLKPDSPAWKLGFKSFDPSNAGRRH